MSIASRAALLLLAAVALTGCQDRASSPAAAPTGTTASNPSDVASSTPSPDPVLAQETGRVETGSKPCGILAAAGRIWVSNYGDDNLVSIDPATMKVGKPVDVGTSPCGLAYGAGSIWVENYGANSVTRVDAVTGEVQQTYDVGNAAYDVTYAGDSAWVTNYSDGTVSRIVAATGHTTTIRTGGTPIGIAPAGGYVWTGLGGHGIAAIDVATGRVAHRIRVGGKAGWTAYAGDRVWVNVGEQTVEIDATTARIVRRYDVGEMPADGSVVAGDVWVPDQGGDLYRIHDGRVSGPFASGLANPFVLAGYRGTLWVVDFLGTDVVTFDPRSLR